MCSFYYLGTENTFLVWINDKECLLILRCSPLFSGLTCTEQNFITKAGFHQAAAEHGLVVVAPDTSPRKWFIKEHQLNWFTHGFDTDALAQVNLSQVVKLVLNLQSTTYQLFRVTVDLPGGT